MLFMAVNLGIICCFVERVVEGWPFLEGANGGWPDCYEVSCSCVSQYFAKLLLKDAHQQIVPSLLIRARLERILAVCTLERRRDQRAQRLQWESQCEALKNPYCKVKLIVKPRKWYVWAKFNGLVLVGLVYKVTLSRLQTSPRRAVVARSIADEESPRKPLPPTRRSVSLRKSIGNIIANVEKLYVPSNSGLRKFADSNPSATLAPHRIMGTADFAKAIFVPWVGKLDGVLICRTGGGKDCFCIVHSVLTASAIS